MWVPPHGRGTATQSPTSRGRSMACTRTTTRTFMCRGEGAWLLRTRDRRRPLRRHCRRPRKPRLAAMATRTTMTGACPGQNFYRACRKPKCCRLMSPGRHRRWPRQCRRRRGTRSRVRRRGGKPRPNTRRPRTRSRLTRVSAASVRHWPGHEGGCQRASSHPARPPRRRSRRYCRRLRAPCAAVTSMGHRRDCRARPCRHQNQQWRRRYHLELEVALLLRRRRR